MIAHPSKITTIDSQVVLLLVLSLVGYPAIAPVSLLLGVANSVVSIPFRAVVLMLAFSIITRAVIADPRIRLTPFWVLWSVFWVLYITRMTLDSLLAPESLRMPLSEYFLFSLGTCLLPALGVGARVSPEVFRRANNGIIVLGSVAVITNIAVIASEFARLSLSSFFVNRLVSSTLNPISLGHLGVTVFILSAWSLIGTEAKPPIPKFILFGTCFLGIVTAVMAASRGPLSILFLIAPLLLYEAFRNNRRAAWWLVVALALPALGILWLLANVETISALTRLQEFASDELRRQLWSSGWQLFLAKPFLGGGTEPLGLYPHNTILESLLLFGIFSGIIYILLLIVSVRAALKTFLSKSEFGWVSLLYFQAVLGMMVSGSLYGPPSQWVLMAAVVAGWHSLSGPMRGMSRIRGDGFTQLSETGK